MRVLRATVQVVIAITGWVLFGAVWWYVAATHPPARGTWVMLVLLVAAAVAFLLLTYVWLRYNVEIYRRKGPRRSVPRAIHDYSRDSKGVPVRADLAQLRGARYVVISQTGDQSVEKVYVAGSAELSAEEAGACTM